ncbi:MAG: HD domain-containing protein [Lachnospiraceae bacterium]|nr:HD domain-containing protein [Lachnospiraceae bacterium]
MNEEVQRIILKYGKHILCTEEFRCAFEQVHHQSTTVGDHTLGVTVEAVKFCIRHGLTDDITLGNVVTASLCHDLGIMGRHEKFENSVQCLRQHPKHSVERYMDITGEENERVREAIAVHMFPLRLRIPTHKEAWILTMADKLGAVKEKIGRPPITQFEREMIMADAADMTKGGQQTG